MGWYLYGKADANMYGPPHQQGMDMERRNKKGFENGIQVPNGTESTVHGTMTGSRTGSPTDHYQTGVHILARHIRCPYLLKKQKKGGSVEFTVPREFSTDLMVCEQV